MIDQGDNKKAFSSETELFQLIEASGGFQIAPYDGSVDFQNQNQFTKLNLTSTQKTQVNALLQHIPLAMASGTLAQAYTVSFPEGLPHVLASLKRGGFMSMIRNPENGQFLGTASLYPASAQAAFFGAFSVMSIASGQYFLSQINDELKMITLKLDKILEFLYGDKKAELVSEISFVRYAHQNYSSIMTHDQHRVATIVGLQEAKKIAIKDVEFYIGDLDFVVNSKDSSDVASLVGKSFQIKESLDMSMQLYISSSLLEVYFAQNCDPDYIQYVENDMAAYIDKSEKRMLSSFSVLNKWVADYKGKPWEKVDKTPYEKQVKGLVESLNSGSEFAMRKSLRSVLRAAAGKEKYYLSRDGNVYLKAI
jgi:hypothetical protein